VEPENQALNSARPVCTCVDSNATTDNIRLVAPHKVG
jgi:hypothetical protein